MDESFELCLSLTEEMRVALFYEGRPCGTGMILNVDLGAKRLTVKDDESGEEVVFGYTKSPCDEFEEGWRHLFPDPLTDALSFSWQEGTYGFESIENEVFSS